MADRIHVLVGTKKGAFIYTSDAARERWQVSDPILPGWSVFHMSADTRGAAPRLFAAANHWAWGRSVAKSDDLGKTWDWRSEHLGFPKDMGQSILNVWTVQPGHASQPDVVYAGTQPAGLFRSEDRGRSWEPVDGLNRHPTSARWSGTGGGDSCVHSVEVDPRDANLIYANVSAGGTFRSRDGGKRWDIVTQTAVPTTAEALAFTKAIVEQFADAIPEGVDPLAVNETHKMRIDPKQPERIWTQTHVGVFRSDDEGDTWTDVTEGLPSFHGFPIAITKRAPDAAYVVPLEMGQDNFRVCPGQFTVYRTGDSGRSWEALTKGLPGPHDYQSAYREALDTDGLDREGVYVGTSNGAVYASADHGDTWRQLPGTLPPILSVTAAVL
jgi:photosystem II stability/assembly factor-like uncharacterized protein